MTVTSLELPQARDFEHALLGRCLLDGVCPGIRLDDWAYQNNRMIHQAMIDLSADGQQIDMLSVMDRLESRHILNEIGGAVYLSQLLEVACDRKNVDHYERHLRATAQARKILITCARIAGASSELKKRPLHEWIGELQQVLDDVGNTDERQREPEIIGDILRRELPAMEERRKRGRALLGYSTGRNDNRKLTTCANRKLTTLSVCKKTRLPH